ncbi:olfactory receptor 14I1-like [Eublepharis macularius]|uniref:Olfactory receptor n=1 Tax=Eublepharis macularius TaxID=481883 RepID=A0AA97LBD2_EUBMA|nr:olfactory receptor 14I1-like [Eublepharis macularius]
MGSTCRIQPILQENEMLNETAVTEFLLMGFSDIRDLEILGFVIFLSIYSTAVTGNLLLVLTIIQNRHLHSPMYYFLGNLSVLDAFYISVTVPKLMAMSLTNNKLISFSGCVVQVFLVITFAGSELSFLTVMAYDRYVAICHPLQYMLVMKWNACFQMAASAWICSLIYAVVQTANTFKLHFCRSTIKQFFCDIPQLLIISCTDTTANLWLTVAVMISLGSFCFFFILVSYGFIFSTVFKIQSAQARYKAFSTCIPHLIVFCLFLSTAMFSYFRPKSMSSPSVDLLAAVLYIVLPPLMNPIIYSLRNKEIQEAMQKMSKKLFGFQLVI